MAIGRISGPLLKSNLLRDGVDLAFETDLLYLDVNNSSIGIGKSNPDPAVSLDVFGRINSDNSVVTPLALLGDVRIINNSVLSTNGNLTLQAATVLDEILLDSNTRVQGNLHATGNITADGSIILGDADTDNISFNADVNSNILPDATNTYNLGSDIKTWLRGYFETIDADNIIISTDVNGRVTYVTDELQKVYVQLGGDDVAGDGNNLASAYRTIRYALSQTLSGQTLVISPGVYQETFPLTVPQGVAVVGSGLRSTTIIPTTATRFNNCFLLSGESTVQNLTIKDMFYDTNNDTGYAFSYAPSTIITTRSPYVKDVSVINRGSVFTGTSLIGRSVAVGSNRIVVGSPLNDENGTNSGSAYIFDLNGNQIAKITSSDIVANDQFGHSVAVGLDRIVVGAYGDDDAGSSSGSVYIFDLNGNQLAKITASDAAAQDVFGFSVAVGSDRIVVGAYGNDDAGSNSGSAYIFDLNGNQIAKITASDAAANDQFGYSVAVGSDRIVVGSVLNDDNGTNSGSAYIFDLNGNQLAKITASDAAANDVFGRSVAVGSNRIVVSAYGNDDAGSSSGSVYIFDLNGNQLAKITASDAAANDVFGFSVAVGSDRIVVGAFGNDDNGSSSGSAYIFDLNGNQIAKITASDAAANDQFGHSVAVGLDKIVVGSIYDFVNGVCVGSAYIFDLTGNQLAKITDNTANVGDIDPFGYAIGDAGRGIKVDGALVQRSSLEAAMLFDSITLIVPNSKGLEITNGARVEWLNSFIYFADLGIHGYAGTQGFGQVGKTYIQLGGITGTIQAGDIATFTSADGSTIITATVESLKDNNTIILNGKNDDFEMFDFTPESIQFSPSNATASEIVNYNRKEFGAELRSIASANVYGDRGVLADGDDVRLRLSSHDFGYIGSRGKFDNDDSDVVTANEIIQVNGGRVFFNSTDQYGDFRVGEYFRVNQETGEVTFDVEGFQVQNSTGITVTDGINTAILSPIELQVGNLNLAGNSFTSTLGDINIESASDFINIDSTTVFNGSHPFNVVLDEDDLISDRDDAIPTQQSVKKYINNREADSIPLGYPEDSVWEDGAYIRFRSDDTVAQAIDDLNEIINNVRRNSFVRAVDFAVIPTAIGSGKDLNITLTPDGTPNQYEIDWGDGTTPQIVNVTADGTPVILARSYNRPDGGLFTVSVIARHTAGKLSDDSYTTGSFEFESKIDYITIYTPDPVVDFDLYRALTGGSSLTGNNLYVIEGQNLFLDNLTTNTLVGNSEFEINWGDGTAIETIIEPRNITTVPGGVSGPRLQHTWGQGTSTGTGLDTVTLTITAMSTSDPVTISARPSDTLQLKVYEDTPAAPDGLSTKTIAFASSVGTSPLLVAGATDNTPGTTLLPGVAVNRTVLTTGTIDSTIIPTFAYDADAGDLSAVFNDVADGVVTLTTGDQTGTYTSLNITAENDYNLLNATGSAIAFANSIYYPGAFKGFTARVRKAASAVNFGVNRFRLLHSTTGVTNTVEFVKDDLTATPIVTAGTLTQLNAGTLRYISGIPYYNTGSPTLRLSGITVNNFIGQTYRNTTSVLEVTSGTNLESTTQAAIDTQLYNYSTINGTSSFLTGGIPNANTGNGTPYSLGNITVNITAASVRTVEGLQLRAFNVNGTGAYVSNTVPVQVHTAAQSGISEIAITVSPTLGNLVLVDAGRRIFNFASNPVSNPAFSRTGVNYYTANPYTETANPGVQGTKEATIRLGRLEHNVVNYSTYLPAGPNRSGDTGTQYFTFAFRRQVVANFRVNIVSATGISGFWIAAPGTAIDLSSTLSGWLNAALPYNGSGLPGAGPGGNGSNGCASTSGDVILSGTALSGLKTLTLGTENLSNATNNVCLIRIALAAGQSITSLGIS